MFRSDRRHAWLTVPALVLLPGSLAVSDHLWFALMVTPPVAVLPLVLHALVRPSPRAHHVVLTLARALAYAMLPLAAWWLLQSWPMGGVGLLEGAALSVMLRRLHLRSPPVAAEVQLALLTVALGVCVVTGMALLSWMGPPAHAALGLGAALAVGGGRWAAQAHRSPGVDHDRPRAAAKARAA